MPLSQHKTELALQWHRKHYNTEYIAQLLNTTPEEIQPSSTNTNNKLNPRKHKIPLMSNVTRDAHGRITGGVNNPTGKGGFQERPQDRSRKWTKRGSVKYNLQQFLELTNEELAEWVQRMDELTQAEQIALRRVLESKKDGEKAFRAYQDIANRTEGMPRQQVDQTVQMYEPPTINVTVK